MSFTPAQFDQKLKSADALPPVVLIAGNEPLLVLEAADGLRRRARELGFDEREVLDADARFDWSRLHNAGASMSLFASQRVIDLRLPTGRPGKQGSAALVEWCKSPPDGTTLLISCNEWSKKHEAAWSRAVGESGWMVIAWPVRPGDLPEWVAARLASRGVDAGRDAVAMLIERTEGNLLAAAQEIDKLAILADGQHIDANKLMKLVADSARFDVFQLADAALSGDAPRALRILRGLRAEGEDVVPVTAWLARQIEVAMRLAAADDFNRQARSEHLWAERQQVFRRAIRRGNGSHWAACLLRASRLDRMSKGRADGEPWREAERLVLAMADPAAAAVLR